MIRLLVLGSTGMLGNAVTKHFLADNAYEVTVTHRSTVPISCEKSVLFDAALDDVEKLPAHFDYAINCIGVIKPFMDQDAAASIRINSLFPWLLARWCNHNGIRLIHITTDCVYSGNKGKYMESDWHDALDSYGKSKSLGECVSEAMVIRTSIIGEEIHKNASLLAWAKSQKGKNVDGFTTHLWNGVTTNEYARICHKIISNDWYQKGLFHVFAQDDVSKFDMLRYIDDRYQLGIVINPKAPTAVDRTMRTEKALCAKLEIPPVAQMIMNL